MEDKIIYAPVLITTLNRYSHLRKELESLKLNGWACYTDVFVAVDYPPNEKYVEGYKKIHEYLDTGDFSVFASFNVIYREKNYGAALNSKCLRESIEDRFDRWISLEDDLELSPDFLEFMDLMLERYKDDNSVHAINGYSYPLSYKTSKGASYFLQGATYSAWGSGNWKNRAENLTRDLSEGYLEKAFKSKDARKYIKEMIKCRKYDYLYFVLSGATDPKYYRATDISTSIYINLKGYKVVTPTISKVRNLGFDGSGLYCGDIKHASNRHSQDYDYANQPIDTKLTFEDEPDTLNAFEENKRILDDFLFVPWKQRIRVWIMYFFYLIGGTKLSSAIYSFSKNKRK